MEGYIGQEIRRSSWQRATARYLIAVACVATGLILASWMDPLVDASDFLLAAVLVAAWFSGLAPALLASLLATLALDYFFTPPFHQLTPEPAHVPRLLLFALVAMLFAGASAGRRRVERSLKQLHDELETKVQERTAELTRANHEAIAAQKRSEDLVQELAEVAGRLIHAQEQERSRIGRELHDHISQMLGVLTIKIDQLRAEAGTPPALASALDGLRADTAQVTDDVHSLSHRLHSSALDYLGLLPALQRLISEFSTRHGIAVDFTHTPLPRPLPADAALCLFRVTEESLTNIAKHSHAKSARIDITTSAEGIRLKVEDSGDGFDPAALAGRAGLGFVSMRERLRALHGVVRVESAPARGTTIDVWLPMPGAAVTARTERSSLAHDAATT